MPYKAEDWMIKAYELGKKGPGTLGSKTLDRILADPKPTNWIKWWRRGYKDGVKERALQS